MAHRRIDHWLAADARGLPEGAFGPVFDLSADPHMITLRHEDHVASGQGDASGHPRPLRAPRTLRHLDHDFLARLDQFLDLAPPQLAATHRGGRSIRLLGQDVRDVEEGVSLQSDIDERGIHSGKHVLDDSFEYGAHDALFALDAILHELVIFEDGDARLSQGAVDDDFDVAGRFLGRTLAASRGLGRVGCFLRTQCAPRFQNLAFALCIGRV
mgnify:CR=1 FL=1